MKIGLNGTGVLALAGVAVAGWVAWKVYKGAGAAADVAKQVVTQDLNPASDKNIAYRGVNAAGAALTGNASFSLGSWLYDVMHPSQLDPTAPTLIGRPGTPSTGDFSRLDRSTFYSSGASGSGSMLDAEMDFGYDNPNQLGWGA